jgi:chemotaxis protein MotB
MPKNTWLIAVAISVALLLVLGGLQIREHGRRRETAEAAEAAARRATELLTATNTALAAELEGLRERTAELEQEVQQAAKAQEGLEQQMRAALESRDVTISELQGKLTVDIVDRVLFDSGLTTLKAEGQAVLRKVAGVLAKFPKRTFQIVGHTDNVPIRTRTADGFSDNWGLSAGRAVAAVRFLVSECGVAPQRLTASGGGEYQPIADNASAEGRAKNRRIAVVVLPEEFAAPDLRKPSGARGVTNLPPELVAPSALGEPSEPQP